MHITLSWDLFIIVFFAVIITYSFIIGMKESVKVIIASYIGIVAVQGLGNLLGFVAHPDDPLLQSLGFSLDVTMLAIIKLVLLIATIIFLSIKSGLDVQYIKQSSPVTSGAVTGIFGFATAGLLLSTVLTYMAGVPLLDTTLMKSAALSPLMSQSTLMGLMVNYQDAWFALPAFLLIGVGFLNNR